MSSETANLRQAAEAARTRGDLPELLPLLEQLMALQDDGDPIGVHAFRAGSVCLSLERWMPGLSYLRRAQALVQPGTALQACILCNLAYAYAEMEAPHEVLTIVDEYITNLTSYPPESQALLGRMLQHKAAALEILQPEVAPVVYAEAANLSHGEIRELALIDGAWAHLQIRQTVEAAGTYSQVNPEHLGALARFAYLSVGAFLLHAHGALQEAERTRLEALEAADKVAPQTRKKAMLVLLGGELALARGDIRLAEALGTEAAAVFRQERLQHLYTRAQQFLARVVRARLA